MSYKTIEIKDLSDLDGTKVLTQIFGMSQEQAELALALERGEIDGDVIEDKQLDNTTKALRPDQAIPPLTESEIDALSQVTPKDVDAMRGDLTDDVKHLLDSA